ncbi:methyltransferase family protein [Williamwhitmania taraxaci]|uniref:Phospholipid methyltransferase n=1 Tax=Williamwhitmania taraxaci TaxID=1640674 RepID=A0A1G6GKT7_9BACT|nr:isoprenylcysteine carboxylmethyltransferase family protein [Williamwhitmania taraxaci]SDB82544.1 Phospholipid methyltransferase [Williamwhitmania taraxaci]
MNNLGTFLATKGLTFLQFGLIAVLLLLGPIVAHRSYLLLILQVSGMVLGIIAIFAVGLNQFSAYPTPRNGSKLITAGPFKIIRNPMYLAVFLFTVPITLDGPSMIKAVGMVALAIVILAKISVEERLLEKQFSEYEIYKKRSWRLIPFIY